MPDNTALPAKRSNKGSAACKPLLLAALVLFATLLITFSAWHNARLVALSELESDFAYRARDMASNITRRADVYEQVLRGVQGLLLGSVEVGRKEFSNYFAALKLEENFPGIEALGISTIIPKPQLSAHIASVRREGFPDYDVHPGGDRDIYTSITQIEPFTGRNLRAFGYDMFSEPNRRAAMERARDTGKAAATGKVILVQEGGKRVQFGFLLYLPLYRVAMPVSTIEQRRTAIRGWVYAPFRMNDFMRGLGGEHSADLDVTIYDAEQADDSAVLYRSSGAARTLHRHALFSRTMHVDIAGRNWTVLVDSAPSLEAKLDRSRPLVIALTGAGLGFLLSVVVWLLASERGRALHLAEVMTHELRQSRDHIEAEEKRMKAILQTAYDAFIAIDPQGKITDWNAQATRLFGWTEKEAIGQPIDALVVPADQQARHRATFAELARTGDAALLQAPTEMAALHKSGARLEVEVTVATLPTPDGYGATAFVRDIGPRKEAERRERLRQQRLDEARSALQRSQRLEAIGQLTGGVAHDFNNILHIISANVQLMLKSDERNRKRLHSILDAVERGSKLVAQLLAFARRQPLHPSVVNVADLIERSDALLHRAAGDAIRLHRISQPELWNTLVDPNQLDNVILNLVINARDAMHSQGDITIELRNETIEPGDAELAPGQYVLIAVRDTGSGMPPDVIEHAFEPFFTTKPEGKGTGLGLAMAHGFVTQSGGHIRIDSAPGEGTTVSIYLPRCQTAAGGAPFLPNAAAERGNAPTSR